jgi:hypothetical protein
MGLLLQLAVVEAKEELNKAAKNIRKIRKLVELSPLGQTVKNVADRELIAALNHISDAEKKIHVFTD